jgi:hypothetical protein
MTDISASEEHKNAFYNNYIRNRSKTNSISVIDVIFYSGFRSTIGITILRNVLLLYHCPNVMSKSGKETRRLLERGHKKHHFSHYARDAIQKYQKIGQSGIDLRLFLSLPSQNYLFKKKTTYNT